MSESPDAHLAWLCETFESHHQRLMAYALKASGGRHEWAEEAVQETFLRLCRQRRETLDGRLTAWLFKVCRSRIIDMQRTNHAPPPAGEAHVAPGEPSPERRDEADSPAAQAESNEIKRQLRQRVEALPERQRELLYLKIHGQLSYREIAEATGLSVSNVGFLLHRAMQTLRSQFSAADA